MSEPVMNSELDSILTELAGTHIHFCSAAPASYAEIAGVELAGQPLLGECTLGDGNISGRKIITPAQFEVVVDVSGICTHVVMSDGAARLLRTTTCQPHALTAGGVFHSPSFEFTIRGLT